MLETVIGSLGSGRSPREGHGIHSSILGAALAAQSVKNLPPMRETRVRSLGGDDPLEKEMATHSSILAWKNPMDTGAWCAMVHAVSRKSRTCL